MFAGHGGRVGAVPVVGRGHGASFWEEEEVGALRQLGSEFWRYRLDGLIHRGHVLLEYLCCILC